MHHFESQKDSIPTLQRETQWLLQKDKTVGGERRSEIRLNKQDRGVKSCTISNPRKTTEGDTKGLPKNRKLVENRLNKQDRGVWKCTILIPQKI